MSCKAILMSTLASLVAACSSTPKSTPASPSPASPSSAPAAVAKAENAVPSAEAKLAAQKEKASYVIEVSFDKGSSDLSTHAKDKIDEVLQRSRRDGTIEDVKVIAWADAEYPSSAKKALSKKQRQLADRRAKAINDYIKAQSPAKVDTYNMAARPNALQKLVNSPDARIKRNLEDAGIATTAHDLRYPENASKAMMMVILK